VSDSFFFFFIYHYWILFKLIYLLNFIPVSSRMYWQENQNGNGTIYLVYFDLKTKVPFRIVHFSLTLMVH